MAATPSSNDPSSTVWDGLDGVIRAFEEAWRRGDRPVLDEFLPADAAARAAVLPELIHADLEFRLRAREPARIEEYLARYRDLANDADGLTALATAEFAHRRRWEGPVDLEEYEQRFPHLADNLSAALRVAAARPSLPRIPGYAVLNELGRGTMGVVCKARQLKLNRIVALKMMAAGFLADLEQFRRFRTEADAVARLQHPNIVQIFEVGEHDGLPYLALEYVDGGNLAAQLRGAPQMPRDAARLIETLALAVHHAHERGVIHRDLKPANIMLAAPTFPDHGMDSPQTCNGSHLTNPKITDFGLAKRLDVETLQTATGSVLGTPCYMAPEQARGDGRAVGPAADIYALGAMLYELLTGRPPFRAATVAETIHLVLEADPAPLRSLCPRLPQDLETICLTCLEKEPCRRYSSALVLAGELGRFARGEGIQARPLSLGARAARWARRRPAVAGLLVALAALVTGSLLGLTLLWLRAAGAYAEAEHMRQAAEDRAVRLQVAAGTQLLDEGDCFGALTRFVEALRADQARPDRTAIHRLRIGMLLAHCPTLVQAWSHSGSINTVAFSPDGRTLLTAGDDRLVRTWDTMSGRPGPRLPSHSAENLTAAFSSDGRRVVTTGWDSPAHVWQLSDGLLLGKFPADGSARFAGFSPGGERLVTAEDRRVCIWELAGRSLIRVFPHEDAATYAAFSPSGQQVITLSDRVARVWDAESGRLVHALPHEDDGLHAAMSPDGKLLATGGKDGRLHLWQLIDGRSAWAATPRHGDALLHIAFARGGRLILTASADQTAQVWDAATGARLGATLRHADLVTFATFAPDDRSVATASRDRTARIWDASTGQPISPLLHHVGMVTHAAFSPDGHFFATASDDHMVRLWDLSGTPRGLHCMPHENEVLRAVFAPDGARVATAGADGTARVWDGAGNAVTGPLRHGEIVCALAFSPDGKQLASSDRVGRTMIWDTTSGLKLQQMHEHSGAIESVTWNRDGHILLSAGEDRKASMWDVGSGRLVFPPLDHGSYVTLALFAPDGRAVLTAGVDGQVRLWDSGTGAPIGEPLHHGRTVKHACFSSDGRWIATAGQEPPAQVWDRATGQSIAVIRKHVSGATHVAFSPDGKRLATAGDDGAARIWVAATGEPSTPPLRHRGRVSTIAFSPCGSYVATASEDRTARLWDAATGQPLTLPLVHEGVVHDLAIHPGGHTLATASADGRARLWDLRPDERSLTELSSWAALLSGYRLDASGGAELLETSELMRTWVGLHPVRDTP